MSARPDTPWRIEDGHVVVCVRVIPNAGRDRIEGVDRLADGTPVLKARVAAVARDGAANQAVGRLIARTLDLPRGAVTLVTGDKARLKRLRIDGEVAVTLARLQRLAQAEERR